MKRTLEEIAQLCTQKKDNFGCILPPMLNIKLQNARVDELHLLLRITGMFILCLDTAKLGFRVVFLSQY